MVTDRVVGEAIRRSRVVAVLRGDRYGDPAGMVGALADCGVGVVEVTVSGPESFAAIEQAATVPDVVIGAGTLTTADAARQAIAAGARFLVAPLGAHEVVAAAGATPVLLIGFTLSEVYAAGRATAMPVMVFPASASGPSYMSTLAGQLPDVPLLPAGGVTLDNAAAYLEAGAVAVAIGESLCPSEAVARGDTESVAARARTLADRGVTGPAPDTSVPASTGVSGASRGRNRA